MCVGAGHADRPDGRHRAGRPARDPGPRPRGPRGHPTDRHHRARQDRDGDHGRARAARRRRSRGRGRAPPYVGWPARSRPPPSTRSAGPSPAPDRTWPWTGFRNLEGRGVRGTVDGHEVLVGRPELLVDEGSAVGPTWPSALAVARANGRTAVVAGWDGRARGVLEVADTVKDTSAEAIRRLRGAGARAGTADRRPRAGRSRGGRRGRDRPSEWPACCPRARWPRSATCRPRAGSWRWSATGSTTRPRWPRPTWASRWAPAPTPRSPPPT